MRTSILAAALLAAAAVSWTGGAARGDVQFVRAEVNGDGILDISDAVHTLILLFLADAGDPKCPDALDTNDDGAADISDAIHILGFLFLGGPAPPQPFPGKGCDPTADGIGCASYGSDAPCDGTAAALIADHTWDGLEGLSTARVEAAKARFRIWYGHTSHGSQIPSGMGAMRSPPYDFNEGLGSLSLQEAGGDLGNPDTTTWAAATRAQLDRSGNDRNLVLWSWCGQLSWLDGATVRRDYLEAMDALEREYPSVTFVYMTGHLDGSGSAGGLHRRNEEIREFCRAGGKVLFDFADLERWDPEGVDYLDRGATDNCDYQDGATTRNWAQEWCSRNPGACSSCDCAHSQSLNCDRKARAFWRMLVHLAER